MPAELSRRSLVAATAATALAGPAAARVGSGVAFGPALSQAHLIYNENPYGPAPSAIRAMAEAAAKGCYYVDEIEPKLTAMIAARLRVRPEQIVLGNGSFEVLAAAAAAWGGGGAILSPDLMFDEPLGLAVRGGARRVTVPLGHDMDVDLDALAARIGPDVSMIYLCNPNNPTAMLLHPAALRGFIRAVPPRVTVLVDEAYNELTDAPEAASVVTWCARALTSSSAGPFPSCTAWRGCALAMW